MIMLSVRVPKTQNKRKCQASGLKLVAVALDRNKAGYLQSGRLREDDGARL